MGPRISKLRPSSLLIVAVCAAAVCGPRAAAQGRATARVKGRGSVVVSEGGRAHTLDISAQADAARLQDATVHFITRRGEFVYLLLSACGMSKLKSDDRQCGAGVECNLVWLKLDARWRVLGSKSERYESCWAPITSDTGPTVTRRFLRLEYEDLRENLRHTVTYDADRPEEGLKSETSPLPAQGP